MFLESCQFRFIFAFYVKVYLHVQFQGPISKSVVTRAGIPEAVFLVVCDPSMNEL
jgi:hypothetical protein